MQIDVKTEFDIGQEVYVIEEKPPSCVKCNSNVTGKTFYHNEYYFKCSECIGQNVGKYIVADGTYVITGMRIKTRNGLNYSISYSIKNNSCKRHKPENNIFTTQEEAEARCRDVTY